jgi:hypothetical protein
LAAVAILGFAIQQGSKPSALATSQVDPKPALAVDSSRHRELAEARVAAQSQAPAPPPPANVEQAAEAGETNSQKEPVPGTAAEPALDRKLSSEPTQAANPVEARQAKQGPRARVSDNEPARPPPATKWATEISETPSTLDIGRVRVQLSAAAARARSCARGDGPAGSGQVRVLFNPAGGVLNATVVSAPFSGTATGACVERAFEAAASPPYQGGSKSTVHAFQIPE